MKIELKNVKHAAFASEETDCFQATVYIDGVREGEVSNEGHGGCNMYHPHTLETTLTAYAKTLPPVDLDLGERVEKIEQDADILIGELFNAWRAERDYRKAASKKLLFQKTDGRIYAVTPKKGETVADLLQMFGVTGLRDCKVILNNLPEAEAIAIYRAGV